MAARRLGFELRRSCSFSESRQIGSIERISKQLILQQILLRRIQSAYHFPARKGEGAHVHYAPPRFCLFSIKSVTTLGSASVEVSPRAEYWFSAILRKIRRMILPDRVLGRPGANWMRSGEAIGPISLRTQATSSLRSWSLGCSPVISVT